MSKLKTVPEDLLGGHQEGSAVDNFVGEHPAPVDLSHSGGEFSAALHKELRKEKAKLGQSTHLDNHGDYLGLGHKKCDKNLYTATGPIVTVTGRDLGNSADAVVTVTVACIQFPKSIYPQGDTEVARDLMLKESVNVNTLRVGNPLDGLSGGSRTWDGGGRQDTGVVCTWHAKLTVDPVRNAEHTHPVSGTDIRTGAEEVAQGKKEA
ncbi:hypothetical protein C8J57DRAFT_1248555 [Mycena rebaudengoi]|nr:hypothetical protein C8J57DRAFT_1248555 [Mycena rebaudengoi]